MAVAVATTARPSKPLGWNVADAQSSSATRAFEACREVSRSSDQWEAAWDVNRQRWYFADRRTGNASWQRPVGCTLRLPEKPLVSNSRSQDSRSPQVANYGASNRRLGGQGAATQSVSGLPNGWQANWDPTYGRYYYFNRDTGERTWRKPKRRGLLSRACRCFIPPLRHSHQTVVTKSYSPTAVSSCSSKQASPSTTASSATSGSPTVVDSGSSEGANFGRSIEAWPELPAKTASNLEGSEEVDTGGGVAGFLGLPPTAAPTPAVGVEPRVSAASGCAVRFGNTGSGWASIGKSVEAWPELTVQHGTKVESAISNSESLPSDGGGSDILKLPSAPPPRPKSGVLPPWPNRLAPREPALKERKHDSVDPFAPILPTLTTLHETNVIAEEEDKISDDSGNVTDDRVLLCRARGSRGETTTPTTCASDGTAAQIYGTGGSSAAVPKERHVGRFCSSSVAVQEEPAFHADVAGVCVAEAFDLCACSAYAASSAATIPGSSVVAESIVVEDLGVLDDSDDHVAEFADLRTGRGCRIHLVEERAVTLRQFHMLVWRAEQEKESEAQFDVGRVRGSRCVGSGNVLEPMPVSSCGRDFGDSFPGCIARLDMHELLSCVILPATQAARCSYVEFVANSPQAAKWFVSHWWGEPVHDLASCLMKHSQDRCMGEDAAYWISACALNPWDPRSDKGWRSEDAARGCCKRVMATCAGTLSVLDRDLRCFNRIWCAYEVWNAISCIQASRKSTNCQAPHLHDMYIPTGERGAVGITDGFAEADLEHIDENSVCSADARKRERERQFPVAVAKQALAVQIQDGSATHEADRRSLLNYLAPSGEPPGSHKRYVDVNSTIQGRFAAAAWQNLLQAGLDMEPYAHALTFSRARRLAVHLYDCAIFTDQELGQLVAALPTNLRELDLRMGRTSVSDPGALAVAGALPQLLDLQELDMCFSGCTRLMARGLEAILAGLRCCPLRGLGLDVGGCDGLGDNAFRALFAALPSLHVQRLSLGLGDCQHSAGFFVSALPSALRNLNLDLRYCEDVDDRFAISLSAAIPAQLSAMSLVFKGCKRITDRSLQALGSGLPRKLKLLNMDFGACGPGLTVDLGLRPLAANLPWTLQRLDLDFTGCVGITLHPGRGIIRRVLEDCPTQIYFLAS